ncbi:MAG: pyridoxamine 5'-phosphate oxidase family protein [Acidimicrobiia bacterium]|nr:pyridoxamine 5'-phosphate oxidase family protein [Acidimicrobiia bacterium]
MATEIADTTILDTHESLVLLRTAEVGRLAVTVKGHPDIFPVNYVVDHGSIVFRTAHGAKLAALVRERAVAFEVDGYDADQGTAWSVVVKGYAVEVATRLDCFETLDLPLFPWHASDKPHFIRIEPTSVTGRCFQVIHRSRWTTGPHAAPVE